MASNALPGLIWKYIIYRLWEIGNLSLPMHEKLRNIAESFKIYQ